MPMHRVRIDVADETGRGVQARVHLVASDGRFYAPLDSLCARWPCRAVTSFIRTGHQRSASPGPLKITAVKGFEYWPAEASLTVAEGASVRLVLRALCRSSEQRLAQRIDARPHELRGQLPQHTREPDVHVAREGQDVVNELVANKDNRILDWMYFEPGGGEHSIEKTDPKMLVLVGEEYRPPFYGHVFYLGLRDHLISPFTTGYEGTGIESLYPSNTDMFRKARSQGAVTGYVHPWPGDTDPLDADLGVGKGFPVDLALGTIDAIRMVEREPRAAEGMASCAEQRSARCADRRRGLDQ